MARLAAVAVAEVARHVVVELAKVGHVMAVPARQMQEGRCVPVVAPVGG